MSKAHRAAVATEDAPIKPASLGSPLEVDVNGPWDEIRRVMNRAPYLKVYVESAGRSLVEIARKGQDSSSGRMGPSRAEWLDLVSAIDALDRRHPDGMRLRMVVELRMEPLSLEGVAARMPGRNSRWTMRKALDEAWYWMCHPAGGRLLPAELWSREES